MKKTIKRIVTLFLCMMLGVTPFLTACGGKKGGDEKVTVSFYEDSVAEAPFHTLSVTKGTVPDISTVTPPERVGESFTGWTEVKNGTTEYDATKKVERDLSLYGMWETNSPVGNVTITFNPNYDGASVIRRQGTPGAGIDFPTVTRENYTFDGWYNEAACETPFGSTVFPATSTTLYAKWTLDKDAVLVTYMVGDKQYSQRAIKAGAKAENIDCNPYEYVFLGWLNADGNEYNFANPVNANLTLYADYYSRGLDIDEAKGEVWGYDEEYGVNLVVPGVWYGDDGKGEPVALKVIVDLMELSVETIVLKEGIEEIENGAFAYCMSLKSISIPSTVTYIGEGILQGCENLEYRHFAGNDTLEVADGIVLSEDKTKALLYVGNAPEGTVTIPSSVTNIVGYAFSYANIGTVVIPSTVTTIARYAFVESFVRNVVINANVTTLPRETFKSSTLLKSVSLASNITTIGQSAFEGCSALSSVEIKASSLAVGVRAFYDCSSLATFPFEKVSSIGENAFALAGIRSFTVPAGTEKIVTNQFANWRSLEEISIPASVTAIESNAFVGCVSLETLTIAEHSLLETIGDSAFSGIGIQAIDLTDCEHLTTIGANAFLNCTSLKSVLLPDGLQIIGSAAFSGCSALEELSLPFVGSFSYEGFCVYFEEAFVPSMCNSLVSAMGYQHNAQYYLNAYKEDPDGFAKQYLNAAGQEWYELHKGTSKDAYYEKTQKELFSSIMVFGYIFGTQSYAGAEAIYQFAAEISGGTPTTYTYYIPASLKEITVTGKYLTAFAFNSMRNYTGDFIFTENLTHIGNSAFRLLASKPSFDFSSAPNLESIGTYAFSNNYLLTELVFPESLVNIGDSAFRTCEALKTVKMPAGSSDKPFNLGAYVFADCKQLSCVYSAGDKVEEGVIKLHNANISNYTFLNCTSLVKVVCDASVGFNLSLYGADLICNAFYGTGLIEVIFPQNASSFRYNVLPDVEESSYDARGFMEGCIPGQLFYGCTKLTKLNATADYDVVIPEGTTAIGPRAFMPFSGPASVGENSPFKTIKFPAGMKKIYSDAFGHTSIEKVDVSMVEDITNGFDYADKVTEIIISENMELKTAAFQSMYSLKTVALRQADGTLLREEKVALLPKGTEVIGNYTFQYTAIEDVRLSEGIKEIGTYAFFSCESLKAVTFPKSLEIIGNGAFEGNYALKQVNFAEGGKLHYLNQGVFEYCIGLESIDLPEGVVFVGADVFFGCISLKHVSLPASLYFFSGAGAFRNCISIEEVVLHGSVPPLIDHDIAGTNYLSSAFTIDGKEEIASLPLPVSEAVAKIPEVSKNSRDMVGVKEDFAWHVKRGLKIYIPEDSVELYEKNIANALRLTSTNQSGVAQRPHFGWNLYKDAFETYESGVYAEVGSTATTAFYQATDGKAWFKLGDGAYTEATVNGNTYTVNGTTYTYNAETNALSKGGQALVSIGGIYMDNTTASNLTNYPGTSDANSVRLLQFRPQLVIGANGTADMYVHSATRRDGTSETLFIPNLYHGSYAISWEGSKLTLSLTFETVTLYRNTSGSSSLQYIRPQTSAIATGVITFTISENTSGVLVSQEIGGTVAASVTFTHGA